MPLLCADLNIVCTRQIIKCYRKTLAIRISPILLSFSLTSRENSLKREQRSEKFAWNVATSQQLVSFNWTSICSKESGGRATSEREMKICAIPRFFMLRRFVERQRQIFPPSELLTGKQQQWAQIGAIWDGQPMWKWNLISLSSSSDWTVMWFSDFYWHTNLSHNYYPFFASHTCELLNVWPSHLIDFDFSIPISLSSRTHTIFLSLFCSDRVSSNLSIYWFHVVILIDFFLQWALNGIPFRRRRRVMSIMQGEKDDIDTMVALIGGRGDGARCCSPNTAIEANDSIKLSHWTSALNIENKMPFNSITYRQYVDELQGWEKKKSRINLIWWILTSLPPSSIVIHSP